MGQLFWRAQGHAALVPEEGVLPCERSLLESVLVNTLSASKEEVSCGWLKGPQRGAAAGPPVLRCDMKTCRHTWKTVFAGFSSTEQWTLTHGESRLKWCCLCLSPTLTSPFSTSLVIAAGKSIIIRCKAFFFYLLLYLSHLMISQIEQKLHLSVKLSWKE